MQGEQFFEETHHGLPDIHDMTLDELADCTDPVIIEAGRRVLWQAVTNPPPETTYWDEV